MCSSDLFPSHDIMSKNQTLSAIIFGGALIAHPTLYLLGAFITWDLFWFSHISEWLAFSRFLFIFLVVFCQLAGMWVMLELVIDEDQHPRRGYTQPLHPFFIPFTQEPKPMSLKTLTRITAAAYRTPDGQTFNNKVDANKHLALLELREWIADMTKHSTLDTALS